MTQQTTYSAEVAAAICDRLSEGESLRAICRDEVMPATSTVCKWLTEQPAFSEQYARAREAQADSLADEILAIADDGLNDTYRDEGGNVRTDTDVIARSKLRVDARKWLASKMAPKKYGDKMAIGGADDLPPIKTLSDDALAAKIAEKMARLNGNAG
jgi:hypothetical protein